jgi:hypothetical protein
MNNIQQWGETRRLLVELAGTAAFALSGVLEGARKKLGAVCASCWRLGLPRRMGTGCAGLAALLTCLLVTASLPGLSLRRQWRLPAWIA